MYVAFTSPHDPRNVLPDYGRKYDSKEITMPKNFITQHPFDNGDLNERDEKLLPTPRVPEQVLAERANYYSMVNEVDVQIGRILDMLEKAARTITPLSYLQQTTAFVSENTDCWVSRICMKRR